MDRLRIALTLDFPDWAAFMAALDAHRSFVADTFNALFAADEGEGAGELGVREEARGLTLPTAIWARWSR